MADARTAPFELGGLTVYPDRGRSKHEFMGRFGGGWNYKLGITAGSMVRGQQTFLIGLLTREYRVVYRTRQRRAEDATTDRTASLV